MNFKFYDILAQLVPGFLVYGVSKVLFHIPDISALVETAFAFVIGYIINSVGSTIEKLYYFTFGGKPSNQLIDNESIKSVSYYNGPKIKDLLLSEIDGTEPSNDKLFQTAYSYANSSQNKRIENFNANYAFSRSLLTSFLITFILLLYQYYNHYELYLIAIPLIIICWARTRKFGYYFSREVLYTYLSIKENKPI